VHSGEKAIIEIASIAVDITVSAIVGIAGLKPTYAALRNGKTVALANKESLVAAGDIIMDQAKNFGSELLPIDSEHSAILQVFEENNRKNIESIILTASGGPFWRNSLDELSSITPAMAIKHPNWSMGTKISIDSATLMNKGLELIEAHYLFNLPINKIETVIHPQSIVHSLVRYSDGSLLAQLGEPDMRTAIACALSWPNRLHTNVKRLSLTEIGKLEFFPLDEERFPAIRLARHSLESQQSVIYNAANEVAVSKFIAGQIKFHEITTLVEKTLNAIAGKKPNDLDEVFFMHQSTVQYINTLFT
jgi:1-deoxy-D-xylulose-5-phosphate reductoisomerase